MRRSLSTSVFYLNKWNNEKVPVFCSSYLLNIVFPSRSRSVPYKLRKSLRDFFCYYRSFSAMVGLDNQFTSIWLKLWDRFKRIVFLPIRGKVDLSYSWDDLVYFMNNCLDVIRKFDDVVFDPVLIESLAYKRNVFINKLFSNMQPVSIADKAYSVRNKFNRSRAVLQI